MWIFVTVSVFPSWSFHAISMPNYPFIKRKHHGISVCPCHVHACTVDVHFSILKWMDFPAWILPWILNGHFYSSLLTFWLCRCVVRTVPARRGLAASCGLLGIAFGPIAATADRYMGTSPDGARVHSHVKSRHRCECKGFFKCTFFVASLTQF